ncbi:MAG: MFS transporter, partial [Limnohabitans sp.]
ALCLWLWRTIGRLQPADELQPMPASARWWTALLNVGRDRDLRRLGLVSLVYAMAQQGFLTFLVSLLHLQGGLTLALAAAILAASQVASTAARVGFGHVADRWISPPRLLGWMGIAMSLGLVMLAWVGTTGHLLASAVVALVCGTFVMGWNGVFFALLVRTAPRERLASATGTTQFLTFSGAMSGPFLVSQWVSWGGSYAQGMLWMAVFPIVIGLLLLRRSGRGPHPQ